MRDACTIPEKVESLPKPHFILFRAATLLRRQRPELTRVIIDTGPPMSIMFRGDVR